MIERIILTTLSILMLSFSLKNGDKKSIYITVGLFIGVAITWTGIQEIITAGMIIYALSAFFIFFLKTENLIMPLTGFLAFTAILFPLLHWPHQGIVKAAFILPIAGYLFLLTKKFWKRGEFGFMTILNVDFILRLINL